MIYKTTYLDAITDFRRAIYASYSEDKFNDVNFKTFFEHGIKILKEKGCGKEVWKRIKKAKDKGSDENKVREDILTATMLLQSVSLS